MTFFQLSSGRDEGLVERRLDFADRRRDTALITEAGLAALERVDAAVSARKSRRS